MSALVLEAEMRMAMVLVGMFDVLQCTIDDALPQSMLGEEEMRGGRVRIGTSCVLEDDIPDTLRQRVEWELMAERARVAGLAVGLKQRMQLLRLAVTQLGGGVGTDGRLVDVSVEVLDRDIAALTAESSKLGTQMLELYDESRQLTARLEAEILEKEVPSM